MAHRWRAEPGPFEGDTGVADDEVAAALAGWAAQGEPAAGAVHAALLAARLLVPVEARAVEVGQSATGLAVERSTEMMLPTVVGADGRTALPAFTSLDTLGRWSPTARPVPLRGADLFRQAVDSGYAAVLVDPAGPVTFVVEEPALADLRAGFVPVAGAVAGAGTGARAVSNLRLREPEESPVNLRAVRRAAESAAADVPGVAGVRLVEATEDGTDWALGIGVLAAPGEPPAYGTLAERLAVALAPVLGDRPVLLLPLLPST